MDAHGDRRMELPTSLNPRLPVLFCYSSSDSRHGTGRSIGRLSYRARVGLRGRVLLTELDSGLTPSKVASHLFF